MFVWFFFREYSPTECHQSYKKCANKNVKLDDVVGLVARLNDFIREGSGQCRCELMQLLYPTFVNIYLDLIARGVSAVGKNALFGDSFYSVFFPL